MHTLKVEYLKGKRSISKLIAEVIFIIDNIEVLKHATKL